MHEHKVVGELTEVHSRLPRFPDGTSPDGPPIRDLATRAVAVLALTATAVYLGWRPWPRSTPTVTGAVGAGMLAMPFLPG